METAESNKKANHIRQSCAGYVGGKAIADKATNAQILDLADLQDEHAELYNRSAANRAKYRNILTAIRAKPETD